MERTSPIDASPNGYPYHLDWPGIRELNQINIQLYTVVSRTVEGIELYEQAVKSGNTLRVASAVIEIILNAHPEDWDITTMIESPMFSRKPIEKIDIKECIRKYQKWLKTSESEREEPREISEHERLLKRAIDLIKEEKALPDYLVRRIRRGQ